MSLVKEETSFTPDDLFAGHVQPVVADSEIVVSGAGVLARGTVLGKITTGGKLKTVDSAAVDGSQGIYAVLAESVDATSADVTAPVYYTGEFNEAKLVFGGTDTADTHRTAARNIGIFFKSAVTA
ncbi:MAG: head decoration protein [Methyloprofundus sp.]|nr:head decoration protein [Methyloprofundus sp.]